MKRAKKPSKSKPQSKKGAGSSSADYLRLYQRRRVQTLQSLSETSSIREMSQVLRGSSVAPKGFRYTLEPQHGIPRVVVSRDLPKKCRRARGDSFRGVLEVAEFNGCYVTSTGKLDKRLRSFRVEYLKGEKIAVCEIPFKLLLV